MTRYLISTRAGGGACAVCKASTLVAYCEGLRVRVDVTPIDGAGEVAALAEGRATYTLIMAGELVHRDQIRIQDPHLSGTVHRQHRCPADQARWRRRVDRANFATARSAGLATRHARRRQIYDQMVQQVTADRTGCARWLERQRRWCNRTDQLAPYQMGPLCSEHQPRAG